MKALEREFAEEFENGEFEGSAEELLELIEDFEKRWEEDPRQFGFDEEEFGADLEKLIEKSKRDETLREIRVRAVTLDFG